jgi:membrane protein implicated in regulation of membrane protease activity
MELPSLSPELLITGGVLLISLEIFLFSFFIIWFGIASLIVGLLSLIYSFESGSTQLIIISTLSLILFFLFAKPLKEKFSKPAEELHEKRFEKAVFKNNKIFFEGTSWNFQSKDIFQEGDEVKVISKEGNTLFVEKNS